MNVLFIALFPAYMYPCCEQHKGLQLGMLSLIVS